MALGLSVGMSGSGEAATWVGGTSTDWNNTANWNGAPAGNNDTVNVSTGNFPIITSNSTFTPVDIFVGSGSGATGRLDHRAGTAATGNGNWFFVGVNSGTGIYNLADTSVTSGGVSGFGMGSGSLTAGRFYVGGADFNGSGTGTANINTSGTLATTTGGGVSISVGQAGTGTMNLQNGTLYAPGEFWIGAGGNGVVNMSGGSITSGQWFVVGRSGTGSFIQSGGTVTGGTSSGVFTTIGSFGGSQGTVNVSGGTFNSPNQIYVGEGGTGTLNVSGSGSVIVGNATEGLRLAVNSGAVGTVNLNGGTIQAKIVSSGTAGTSTFNFNGGTLQAGASSGTFMTGLNFAKVLTGGAKINSNGFDVTIGQALTSGTSNDGGLTKSGNGSLTLTGADTYVGATTVNAGTLALGGAGSVNNSSGIVINGSGTKFLQNSSVASTPNVTLTQGTLAGTGTVGAVTVGAGTGGIVSNGSGVSGNTGSLTIGSLTFSGVGALSLNLAGGNSTATPGVIVTNALTTPNSSGAVTVNVSPTNPLTLGTTYNLLSYGSFSGSLSDFVYGGNSARLTGVFGTSSNFLTLTVNGDAPKWTGLDNGNWQVGSTGANSNWKLQTAGTATNYIDGDLVLFDDTAQGTTNVNIAANVTPGASITFNNTAKDYTVSSSGGFGIGGSGSLLKNGTGKLTISSSNSYTGATTVNNGTLNIQNNNALGNSSGVTVASGASLELQGTALTVDRALNLSGTLRNVSGANTYSGSLALGGSTNVIVQVDTGSLALTNSGGIAGTDANLTVSGSGNSSVAGVIATGVGSLTKNGNGTLVLNGANTYSGGTTINAGTLQINTTAGAANSGTFNLNGGAFKINSSAANFNYAPSINLTAAGSTLGNIGSQINYTGALNGNNNALNIANANTSVLYINAPVTGVTQFNVQSGAMGFDINVGNNRGTASVNVTNGASLWYAGNNTNPVTNNLIFNGGDGMNNAGALYYEGGVPVPAALTGTITLASGTTGIGSQFGDTITLNGSITGAGALKQLNANTIISGSNDYSGGTTITAKILTANSSTALGSGAVSISAASGAQLALGSNVNVANALAINGGGVSGQGALYVPTGDATYNGAINITGAPNAGGHFASGTGILTVSGPVTSSVDVTVRAGTVLFSNTGSSYSTLSLLGGTTKVGATNALPVGATANIGTATSEQNAVLDLNGFNQTLAGITKGAQTAKIINNGLSDATLTTTGNSTYNGWLQDGATNKLALTVNSGSLTLGGTSTFTGDVNVNGGTLLVNFSNNFANPTSSALGNPQAVRNINVNNGGTLNFVQGDTLGGATTNVASTLVINQGGTVTNTGGNFTTLGAVQLNGGTLTGVGGAIPNYQMYALRGDVTVGGTTASTISGSGANAGYHLNTNTTFNIADVTGNSNSDLNVSGILVDQTGSQDSAAGGFTKNGAGTMTLTGNSTYTGVTTISNGVLQLGDGTNGNDGTIVSTGGVVDNSSLVYNRFGTVTSSYAISGGGAVTKIGAGTQILSGSNNYTGATNINVGTLGFSTLQSSIGDVVVASNAILSVKQAIANQTLLSTNSLTLGNSTLTFDFNNLDSSAALMSTNGLTLNGTTGFSMQNGALLSTGTHQLLTYASFGGGGSLLTGTTYHLTARNTGQVINDTNNSALSLVVIANTPIWTGSNGSAWDIETTQNWKSAGLATTYFQTATSGTDSVIFDDTASNTNVDLAMNVAPLGVLVDNSTKSYLISGTGGFGIGGSTSLVKQGSNTLTLTGSNSYTGGTTIKAGTIAINNANSLGDSSGAVTINNGAKLEALNAITTSRSFLLTGTGTIQTDSDTYEVDGVVGNGLSTGSLTKTGNGTLRLTAANTFTGDININGGTLLADRTNNAVNPTTSALGNSQSTRNIIVNNGGTLNFVQGDTLGGATSTVVSTLVINPGGTVTNAGGNFTTLGPVQLNGGTLTGVGGANSSYQMYSLRGDVTVGGTSASTISGSGSNAGYHLNANTTFNVANVTGDANSDLNVSATLVNQTASQGNAVGGLTKTGAGTMTLTGNNTYTGDTNINQGTLVVRGSLSGSKINVNSSGTLSGDGTVGWVALNDGGLVAPGTNGIGTLADNNLYLDWYGSNDSNFAQMKFDLSTIDNSSDQITGLFNFTKASATGTFKFDFLGGGNNNNGDPITGTVYTLIQFNSLGNISGAPFTAADFSYKNLAPGLSGAFVLTANSLQFEVVPEPGTWAMLLGGVSVLGFYRKLRRNR